MKGDSANAGGSGQRANLKGAFRSCQARTTGPRQAASRSLSSREGREQQARWEDYIYASHRQRIPPTLLEGKRWFRLWLKKECHRCRLKNH